MQYSFTILAFATSALAVTQITDGQVQGSPAPSAPVSQITDGQIQAPTAVVSQITDGQIQAPTAATAAVSQITDGQIQAPTAAVSQITDGQIQAPTAAVSQITDGQIQAPVVASTGAPAPSANGTFATSKPSATPFTGAAGVMSWSKEIAVAAVGVAAGFAML